MDFKEIKAPPPMRDDLPYSDWKHEVQVWKSFVNYEKKKLGPCVFLSLSGSARAAGHEITLEDLSKEDGFETLLAKLDTLYLKDENNSAFEAYEAFEKYQRPGDMDMTAYMIAFERLYQKAKNFSFVLPDGVLAYRLLKSANLSSEHEQLARATLPSLTYDNMKNQLKKIFNNNSTSVPVSVKIEPTYNTTHNEAETYYTRGGGSNSFRGGFQRGRGRFNYRGGSANYGNRDFTQSARGASPYGNRGFTQSARGAIGSSQSYGNRGFTQSARGASGSSQPNSQNSSPGLRPTRRLNAVDYNGEISLCAVCGSKYHWARSCPDSYEARGLYTESEEDGKDKPILITLLADYNNSSAKKETLNVFLSETLNFAVVDSGCSKTVCGITWMQCLQDSLSESDLKLIEESPSQTCFKFGDGKKVVSMKKVKFPAYIANKKIFIITDVISNDIPLLLSKESMKKGQAKLNFITDTISILGNEIPLQITRTGHYLLCIGNTTEYLNNHIKSNIVLFSSQFMNADKAEHYKIAVKVHKQFVHPRHQKLKSLFSTAGVSDPDFFESLEKIEKECETCQKFQRGPLRPVVGFSMAKEFNEVVALDLKQWSFSPNIWFCHMIDLATRYSVCVVIHNKKKETIINAIMSRWISIFGSPRQVLSDNGGEFNNEDFRSMAESFNIRVTTTAAESPWSNGCNERYNGIISDMVKKVLNETKCSLEIALAWAVSAKNSLENHNGYSPNQLVFGKNPNYPSVLYDNLPALENVTTNDLIRNNLNALHTSRSAFIQKESCEKLRRAMLHKVRPTGEIFINGDQVLYRRRNNQQWQGPATVIGQENKQILVKHGGVYYRCHSCNLIKNDNKMFKAEENNLSMDIVSQKNNSVNNNVKEIFVDEEDDDCDIVNEHVADSNNSTVIASDENEYDKHDVNKYASNFNNISIPSCEIEKSNQSNKNHIVAQQKSILPSAQTRITYLPNDDSNWKHATVLGRAGKATGKNKYFLNILNDGDESGKCIDWRNVDDWKEINESINFCSDEDVANAKIEELINWDNNKVFKAVPDTGQKAISCRWVINNKIKSDGSSFVKARLVARGFEEDSSSIQTDSPTVGKESFKAVLAIAASKKWTCNSIDIKTAFLQGANIERNVYLRPPREADSKGHLWHLQKCVYGLNDASRYWYMRVRQELFKLNMSPSKYDKAIFYWFHQGELAGVITAHVDDFFWCGTKHFKSCVIDELRNIFLFGEEHSEIFRYVGINVQQQENGKISLNQNNQIEKLETPLISYERMANKDSPLNAEELRTFRGICGQLNWIASQSRPDLSFDVCDLSCRIKNAKVADLLRAMKVIRKAKASRVSLKFPDLDLSTMKVVIYSDASYGNLPDGASQGGHIIFLCDSDGKCAPITWSSTKIKRIARSTLATECLALQDATDAAYLISSLVSEMLYSSEKLIDIVAKTDSKGLHSALLSTKAVQDKRLRVDIAYLKQLLEWQELEKVLWISSAKQLADCLTKRTASSRLLLETLYNSFIG